MATESNALGPPWTIMKLLEWSKGFFAEKGIGSARLDAEILLSETLNMERVQLYAQFDRPLDREELETYRAFVKRRVLGEPVAYLVGRRGFWTFDVEVTSDVLIPRPETESVVEQCLKIGEQRRVLDMGTGSGAIAIALALEWPDAEVVACDVSAAALEVARRNFDALAARISSVESDLFSNIEGMFDMIVSNPPYVSNEDDALDGNVKKFEPSVALFSGPTGLEFYERIAPQALERLNENGWLVVEIGYTQGVDVAGIFDATGYSKVEVSKDLSGNDRVVSARR